MNNDDENACVEHTEKWIELNTDTSKQILGGKKNKKYKTRKNKKYKTRKNIKK